MTRVCVWLREKIYWTSRLCPIWRGGAHISNELRNKMEIFIVPLELMCVCAPGPCIYSHIWISRHPKNLNFLSVNRKCFEREKGGQVTSILLYIHIYNIMYMYIEKRYKHIKLYTSIWFVPYIIWPNEKRMCYWHDGRSA